jgi:hypothetical protein
MIDSERLGTMVRHVEDEWAMSEIGVGIWVVEVSFVDVFLAVEVDVDWDDHQRTQPGS